MQGGMKLVRARNGRAVAVFANVNMALKKKGKMRFLMRVGDAFGREFELMAVMSLVANLMAQRRVNMSLGSSVMFF